MTRKAKVSFNGTAMTYAIDGGGDFTVDVASLPQDIKDRMLLRAAQFISREATAGLAESDPAAAIARAKQRMENLAQGLWRAVSAESAEPRTSLLARAVAEAMGITAEEAAKEIAATIEAAIADAGLDPDDEEQETAIRKIGKATRDLYSNSAEVGVILARLQAENAAKKAQAAVEAAKDKPSIRALMKR